MADTSNQEAPPRKTLQNEIDFLFGKAGGYQYSFVVTDKKGTCKLPPFVNVRFMSCEIDSLQADNTNILYFLDCTFNEGEGKFTFTKSTIIAEECEFNNKADFTQSKLQFLSCDVNDTMTLKDVSYLKSLHCTWDNADEDYGIVLDGSRFESIEDIWGDWNSYSVRAKNRSFAKITSPEEFRGTNSFAWADTKSGVYMSTLPNLEESDNTEDALFFIDNAVLEIYNALDITSSTDLFYVNDGKVVIRGVDKLESTDNGIGEFINSTVDIAQVPELLAENDENGEGFYATDSDITVKEVDKISVSKNLLKLDNSSFLFIGMPFEYNDDNAEGPSFISSANDIALNLENGSNVTLKNVKELASSSESDAFNVFNSTLHISNCNSISSTGGNTLFNLINDADLSLDLIKGIDSEATFVVKAVNNCRVFVDKLASLDVNNTAFFLGSNSSGIISNFETLQTENGPVISLESSSLIVKNCTEEMKSTSSPAIVLQSDSRVSLYDIPDLSSDSDPAISIQGTGCYVEIKNVPTITGSDVGIQSVNGATIIIDNSEADGATIDGGLSLQGTVTGSHTLTMKGPMTLSGDNNFSNYVLDYTGIIFDGDTAFTNCIVNEKASHYQGALVAIGTHLDSIITSVDDDASFTDYSVLAGSKYTVGGKTTITKSIVSSFASLFGDLELSHGGFNFDIGETGSITTENSFIKTFGGTIADITYSNTSTLLGGAMATPVKITTPNDDPLEALTAFFATGGNMGIEADEILYMEANQLHSHYRDTVLMTYNTDITIETTGGDMILKASGDVKITSTSGIVDINGTSIELN